MKKKPNPKKYNACLDQKFWNNFSQTTWEKKPIALKHVKSDLTEIKEAEIFELVVKYSDICRKNKVASGFKLFIDGIQTYEDEVLQFLPLKKDKSFIGYHQRMNEVFSDYCLVCDELLLVDSTIRNKLTDFTMQLYKSVGFPNRFTEIGLYLGNYKKTPFGVHVDNCGVFSFPVTGVKKFRLWTSEFVQKHPSLNRAFNYAKYNKFSEVIKIEPGDMSYWPSSAWHIAESTGEFSATWSLGIWVDQKHEQSFSKTLNELLKNKFSTRGEATLTHFSNLQSANGEVSKLPEVYIESIKALQSLTDAEIREFFLKTWMVHISKQGFKNWPVIELNLSLKSKIRIRYKSAPILWQQGLSEKSKLLLSFAGVLVETNTKSGLFKMIKRLNEGHSCQVGQFISAGKKNLDLSVLQKLANAGAFTLA